MIVAIHTLEKFNNIRQKLLCLVTFLSFSTCRLAQDVAMGCSQLRDSCGSSCVVWSQEWPVVV